MIKITTFLRVHLKIFFLTFLLCSVISCQDDLLEDSTLQGDTEDIASAQLMLLMGNVALNDGSHDNVIDRASCLELVLPVNVEVGGDTYVINESNDIDTLEDLIVQQNVGDSLSIVFPVTVILIDHSAVTVDNQEAFQTLVDTCGEENQVDQDIECVDFQYPIAFNTYDPDFQIADSIIINNDEDLLAFVTLMDSTNIVVSVQFPVTMIFHDGSVGEMTDYDEMLGALLNAMTSCDEDDDYNFNEGDFCSEEQIMGYLLDCYWQITSYNDEDILSNYIFLFENGEEVIFFDTNVLVEASWSLSNSGEGGVVTFSNASVLNQEIGGDWLVTQCSPSQLLMQRGDEEMVMSRNCFEEPLDCFTSVVLDVCNNGEIDIANLDLEYTLLGCETSEVSVSFYTSQADALNEVNPIPNPEDYVITSSAVLLWARASLISNPSSFKVFFIELTVIDCCDNPQLYLDDVVIYMPLSERPIELISSYTNEEALNESVEDRDGSENCAMAFDQDSFTIPVTAENSIVQGEIFSISIWFQMQNEDAGNYETFFQKGSSQNEGFQLGVYDLNTPIFQSDDFAIWDLDWNNEIDVEWTNTDWHHLVITVDASNTVKLYRDGILRGEAINSTLDIGDTPLDEYTIGQGLQGHIDDLRVYKRTLNPTEIDQLFYLGGDCYTCL